MWQLFFPALVHSRALKRTAVKNAYLRFQTQWCFFRNLIDWKQTSMSVIRTLILRVSALLFRVIYKTTSNKRNDKGENRGEDMVEF